MAIDDRRRPTLAVNGRSEWEDTKMEAINLVAVSYSVNGMSANNQWCQKWVVFSLVISQQIKEIIANRHELLSKFSVAQTL